MRGKSFSIGSHVSPPSVDWWRSRSFVTTKACPAGRTAIWRVLITCDVDFTTENLFLRVPG